MSRPLRAVLRAGGDGHRRAHRPAAGDAPLGAGGPGPAGAVRQRDGRGHPQRPAVRDGRDAEPPAARARRGQGRLPARREPQPPDAADEHPRLRRAAERGGARPAAGDHRRAGGAAVADGPPAADRDPPGVGRPEAPKSEVVSLSTRARKAWEALGVDDVPFALEDGAERLAGRRRHRPARPGALGAARQRGQVRCRHPGPGRDRRRRGGAPRPADHRGPRARASPKATGTGCSPGSPAGTRPARTAAAAWASTSRASCAGRWAATSSWSRRPPIAGRRSRSCCRASPATRARDTKNAGPRKARRCCPGGGSLRSLFRRGRVDPRAAGAGAGCDARAAQIIPRGSPTIRAAAAAPMITPRTELTPRNSASIAPPYQPA